MKLMAFEKLQCFHPPSQNTVETSVFGGRGSPLKHGSAILVKEAINTVPCKTKPIIRPCVQTDGDLCFFLVLLAKSGSNHVPSRPAASLDVTLSELRAD